MPFVRNPFRRQDENIRPVTSAFDKPLNGTPTEPVDIKEREPTEYKLSEINDSGVFVPPSPPEERKSFWTSSSSRSTTSSKRPSLFDANEPFNISRESFDSYRRSFDISARSQITQAEQKPRMSLDSRTFLPPPRQSGSFHRPLQVPGTQQEEEPEVMEDVALDDPKPQPPKKRSMLSRIMDSDSHSERPSSQDGSSKGGWHHFPGRKRGQSGQGAELGSMPRRDDATPKPETQLKREERQAAPGAENAQAPDAIAAR